MSLPNLPHLNLHISVFENAWDNRPTPKCCTLAGLVRALTTFPVIETANNMTLPAWSPARFANGAARKSAAVRDVSCVVLDFDAGDPDNALSAWTGVLTVLHTTWSHTPEAPRFRVVVPLARPVPLARWSEAWTLAAARAPGADPACKDPARLYFRPAIAKSEAPHFARVQDGALLDVMALLPDDPPPVTPAIGPARAPLCVPARLREHAVSVRIAHDPDTRERIAADLGAAVTGASDARRATQISCPACARPSVWFYLAPSRLRRARCNHRGSCGWVGPLDELLLRGVA